MNWFEALTGFREEEVVDVASQFELDGETLISRRNGRRMAMGLFELMSVANLRARATRSPVGATTVREVVADAASLHEEASSAGALFQVASQFNMLEMVSPERTPEEGVGRYSNDRTQGPACAVACGSGTIYRNYLVDVKGQRGQSATRQINGLAMLATALGVDIEVRNGYAMPTADQLRHVGGLIGGLAAGERDALIGVLDLGLQWRTEVNRRGHLVSQAFCSALPIGYMSHPKPLWEPLARLVLDGAYEGTLAAAVVNAAESGNRSVFLTLVGGGVFGNPESWIFDSIERAVSRYQHAALDVVVVSYRQRNPAVACLVL